MKKINHRERRESSACTGSVSRTAMLRGSVARPSLPPPPPSRDEHREHNQRHVAYEIVIYLLKARAGRRGRGRSLAKILQRLQNRSPKNLVAAQNEGQL